MDSIELNDEKRTNDCKDDIPCFCDHCLDDDNVLISLNMQFNVWEL